MSTDDFKKRLEALLPDLIAFRRDLHAHPEPGFHEHRTAEKIAGWLQRLPGMKMRTGVGGTGIVATLGAERPGPCLAFRADLDALSVADACGKPHVSTRSGVAHACGHDGHVACLLGAATLMAEMPETLAGPVRLIFQPAEEELGGARLMIEGGALEDPRPAAIFGLHGWPSLPVGTVGLRTGAVMASSDPVSITVRGRGAHAAQPHCGVDPIVVGAHIVTALQSIVSRHCDPIEPAVLTIGMFHAGTVRNVIPDTAELEGTLRTLSESQRQGLRTAIAHMAAQVAAAFGASADVTIETGYPVTVNDADMTDFVRRVAVETLGEARVSDDLPVSLGGEDFAYYLQQIPGCFWRLGIAPADGSTPAPPLHNSAFDFNDEAIATGVSLHCAVAGCWARENPA